MVDNPFAVCETKVNLGFVVDSSNTAKYKFGAQKEMVKYIADRFVLQAGGTKATLVA